MGRIFVTRMQRYLPEGGSWLLCLYHQLSPGLSIVYRFWSFKERMKVESEYFPLCKVLFLPRIEERMETKFCTNKSCIRKSDQVVVSTTFGEKDF